mmetsp:Transcript_49836/g.155948  ORF Transcript_49836/g.155948 Transcript_49836/m.155948 type:complete len:245 (-) Transcript_49836:820-1554(-)
MITSLCECRSKDLDPELRCILCGENKCSGCSALLQKSYVLDKSEQRQARGTMNGKGEENPGIEEGHHQIVNEISYKKDSCYYSQDSEMAGWDKVEQTKASKPAKNRRDPLLQVWFREPVTHRSADSTLLVPKEFTLYEFMIQWGDRRWIVKRRFREFVALDAALDASLPEEVQLPPFPGKKALGRMSPSLIRTRRMELEAYLREVLLNRHISVNVHVRNFCRLPEGCNEAVKWEAPWEEWKATD